MVLLLPQALEVRALRENINRKGRRVAVSSSRWPPALVHEVLVVPSGRNKPQVYLKGETI